MTTIGDEAFGRDGRRTVRLADGVGRARISRERLAEQTGCALEEVPATVARLEELGYLVDLGDDQYLVKADGQRMVPGVRSSEEKAVLRAMFG